MTFSRYFLRNFINLIYDKNKYIFWILSGQQIVALY